MSRLMTINCWWVIRQVYSEISTIRISYSHIRICQLLAGKSQCSKIKIFAGLILRLLRNNSLNPKYDLLMLNIYVTATTSVLWKTSPWILISTLSAILDTSDKFRTTTKKLSSIMVLNVKALSSYEPPGWGHFSGLLPRHLSPSDVRRPSFLVLGLDPEQCGAH